MSGVSCWARARLRSDARHHFSAQFFHKSGLKAAAIGGKVVVKAQVHAGGRGKAGGVKVAADPAEAGAFADAMIGTTLVTFQTGPQGAPVHQVLVEQTMEIERELYLSITTDGGRKRPGVIASAAACDTASGAFNPLSIFSDSAGAVSASGL